MKISRNNLKDKLLRITANNRCSRKPLGKQQPINRSYTLSMMKRMSKTIKIFKFQVYIYWCSTIIIEPKKMQIMKMSYTRLFHCMFQKLSGLMMKRLTIQLLSSYSLTSTLFRSFISLIYSQPKKPLIRIIFLFFLNIAQCYQAF